MPKTSFPLPANKIPLSHSKPPPLHCMTNPCPRIRHLTNISRKASYLEKTRASPLHSQNPGLALAQDPWAADTGLVAIDPGDTGTQEGVSSRSAERSLPIRTGRSLWRVGVVQQGGAGGLERFPRDRAAEEGAGRLRKGQCGAYKGQRELEERRTEF